MWLITMMLNHLCQNYQYLRPRVARILLLYNTVAPPSIWIKKIGIFTCKKCILFSNVSQWILLIQYNYPIVIYGKNIKYRILQILLMRIVWKLHTWKNTIYNCLPINMKAICSGRFRERRNWVSVSKVSSNLPNI